MRRQPDKQFQFPMLYLGKSMGALDIHGQQNVKSYNSQGIGQPTQKGLASAVENNYSQTATLVSPIIS